ncbi:hypothetical protein OGATHE_001314 [Ogataea polymorpha]|uniref:Uncharacterized protein n=1 Tax=Ogataea polymorpha TaxID=460523 RepID=A0A9P8PSV6_9ASCO|nr:hypothetical protein OGATHE_001314 [Ogataea polymorpha]
MRRRSDSEPLLAAGNGREVDGLDVDLVLVQQDVGRLFGLAGVANQQRNDVGRVRDDRNAQLLKLLLDVSDVLLLVDSVHQVLSHDSDGRGGAGHQCRRQSGGEDEAWSKRPDPVDHLGRRSNVAANGTK